MTEPLEECRRCDLWKNATQVVEGEGPAHAGIMLVGEQPGNDEDLQGHPFVGPAGRLLDECIEAAGLRRRDLFITNAVKHFKWKPSGKRRLHDKPNLLEIKSCNIWLQSEIEQIRPHVIVALGATALRGLMGRTLTIDGARREALRHVSGTAVVATYHPSAILRARDEDAERLREALIADLTKAGSLTAPP